MVPGSRYFVASHLQSRGNLCSQALDSWLFLSVGIQTEEFGPFGCDVFIETQLSHIAGLLVSEICVAAPYAVLELEGRGLAIRRFSPELDAGLSASAPKDSQPRCSQPVSLRNSAFTSGR